MLCSYGKSKVFAEQAVWDFVEQRKLNELHCFEVAVNKHFNYETFINHLNIVN
jgi:hypothetical protein